MERLCCLSLVEQMPIPKHVQGNPVPNMLPRPNTIHRFLHFPKSAIATLHRIRCRRKFFVIQKDKTPIQRRRLNFFQYLRQPLASLEPHSQLMQFSQCRRPKTTTIIQTIHLLDKLTQGSQLRYATGDLQQCLSLLRR